MDFWCLSPETHVKGSHVSNFPWILTLWSSSPRGLLMPLSRKPCQRLPCLQFPGTYICVWRSSSAADTILRYTSCACVWALSATNTLESHPQCLLWDQCSCSHTRLFLSLFEEPLSQPASALVSHIRHRMPCIRLQVHTAPRLLSSSTLDAAPVLQAVDCAST